MRLAHYLLEVTVMRPNPRSSLKAIALISLFVMSLDSAALAQTLPGSEANRESPFAPAATRRVVDALNESAQSSGRRSDPLWNGAAIGAGVAIASGLFACTRMEPWENCRDDVKSIVTIGAIGAGIGMGIDALIRGRASNSALGPAKVHAAPIVSRQKKGVRMAVSF